MAAGGCRRRPAACRDEPGTKNLQETGAVSVPRAGQTRGCPPPGPPCLPVCALKAKAFSPGSQRGRPLMPRLRFPSIVAPRRQLCAGEKSFLGIAGADAFLAGAARLCQGAGCLGRERCAKSEESYGFPENQTWAGEKNPMLNPCSS